MNHWPRFLANSSSALRFGATLLLAFLVFAAHSSTSTTAQQKNSNSGKRPHATTLRSSDSQEGSRVAITSDQSLNNYEAYRRGDRFYVKIPAGDVPRAEGLRGRGFADVNAQRSGDGTILSFRLQPGATAHVEQRANKLDVVVTVPGGTPGLPPKNSSESDRFNQTDSDRSGNQRATGPKTGNRNDSARANPSDLAQINANKKPAQTGAASANPTSNATPAPGVTATPLTSLSSNPSPTPRAVASATAPVAAGARVSPTALPTNPASQTGGSLWARLKERGHYWLLLAQLNPIPVAIGAAILILIIGLLLAQRRRARSTRRVGGLKPMPYQPATQTPSQDLRPAAVAPKPASEPSLPVVAAATAAVAETTAAQPARAVTAAAPSLVDDARREHVNHVADEARKLFDGEQYNEAIIGSDDPNTRRLVGAELLSALVGRNAQKRERARAAFMDHGYFDDATRDLRVAESDNERAAAARRLSFVHDRQATPHLIGALSDPSPDVRRASVEALMDLRDPSAIGSLNTLLQTENDRKVPRPLIKQAIEACATSHPETGPSTAEAAAGFSHPAPQSFETDREVIEI